MALKRVEFIFGFVFAGAILGAGGEIALRSGPPSALEVFLPQEQSRRGPFVADPDLGVRYRSPSVVYAENAADLAAWLDDSRHQGADPAWLFIGSSFVHGAGMLADRVRAKVPGRRVVTLHRTDPLPVRLAQVEVLRAHAPPPERIFLALGTVDLLGLGEQPLATLDVTAGGALTYAPRLPPGRGAWLVRHSRLAAAAWARTGRHRGNPDFDKRALDTRLDEPLRSDLQALFAHLARRNRTRVAITVILIPSYQQLVDDVAAGFQGEMRRLLEPLGYDVVDPLPRLRQYPDPAALFLPDKHFTPVANALVVDALLSHLRRGVTPSPPLE